MVNFDIQGHQAKLFWDLMRLSHRAIGSAMDASQENFEQEVSFPLKVS